MRVALDTNVLAYAEGLNESRKNAAAVALLQRLAAGSAHVPVQVLGELFLVLVRKASVPRSDAKTIVLRWCDQYPLVETSPAVLFNAMDLASRHDIRIWDSIVISAAASAGCRLLLSEDMQDGFTWSGVTVVNPFSSKPHELLTQALDN